MSKVPDSFEADETWGKPNKFSFNSLKNRTLIKFGAMGLAGFAVIGTVVQVGESLNSPDKNTINCTNWGNVPPELVGITLGSLATDIAKDSNLTDQESGSIEQELQFNNRLTPGSYEPLDGRTSSYKVSSTDFQAPSECSITPQS